MFNWAEVREMNGTPAQTFECYRDRSNHVVRENKNEVSYQESKHQQDQRFHGCSGFDMTSADEVPGEMASGTKSEHIFQSTELTILQKEFLVLSGYKACTEETLRYLVEDEGLPLDDPLVIGLQQHLVTQQMKLKYYQLFDNLSVNEHIKTTNTNCNQLSPGGVSVPCSSADKPISYYVGCPLIQWSDSSRKWQSTNSRRYECDEQISKVSELNVDTTVNFCDRYTSPTPSL
ncbi:Uncharacterised protein g1893 [Pycnogonum litorale]